MVLDDGRVAEFDTPNNLLQSNGVFASMARNIAASRQAANEASAAAELR